MADYLIACKAKDIPSGSMKQCTIGKVPVLIAHVGDDYFAVSDTCTHAACSLANDGFIENNVITCGCHGAQFHAGTGKAMSLLATVDLAAYEVLAKDGNILVKI